MLAGKKNIIWLASYPKSGNTWFRVFLSNLFSGSDKPVNINNLHQTPISSSRFLIDKYLGVHSSELSPEEVENFQPEVYKMISAESERDIFLKTHDAWRLNPKGESIFPIDVTKGVLYFIRNPLDIAVSCAFHNAAIFELTIHHMNKPDSKICGNKERLFDQLPQHLNSWSDHVISWINQSGLPVHIIRYEDMLEHPYETFSQALNFLNFTFRKSSIDKALRNSSIKTLSQQEDEYGFLEKSIHSKKFFRNGEKNWKYYLNKSQVYQIIKHHHIIMEKFGYVEKLL